MMMTMKMVFTCKCPSQDNINDNNHEHDDNDKVDNNNDVVRHLQVPFPWVPLQDNGILATLRSGLWRHLWLGGGLNDPQLPKT